MIELREAPGLTDIGAIQLREVASGPLTEIGEVWLRETPSGPLTLIWSASSDLEAVPSETDVYGGRSIEATVAVTTFGTTVAVTGGVAPYTHSWARTDGGSGTWDILVDGATARFRRNAGPGEEYSATFADTVTDKRGNTVTTVNVQATVHNFGGLGGLIP